jgi:hypothetical protein
MQVNATPSVSTSFTRERNVDGLSIAFQQAPEHSGTAVAEHSTLPVGKNGRHPPAMRRQTTVSNCIHPAIDPMEISPLHARCDRVSSQPNGNELSERDDTMLPFGDVDHAKVRSGAFFPHVGEQVATLSGSPPRGAGKDARGSAPRG